MKKSSDLKGLSFRGSGYLLYIDESSPRLTNKQVVRKIRRHINKKVVHIGMSAYAGHRDHVLQLEYLYNRDMEKSTKKLANKFNQR